MSERGDEFTEAAKEATGKVTDNERLEAEGEAQKAKGKAQSAG